MADVRAYSKSGDVQLEAYPMELDSSISGALKGFSFYSMKIRVDSTVSPGRINFDVTAKVGKERFILENLYNIYVPRATIPSDTVWYVFPPLVLYLGLSSNADFACVKRHIGLAHLPTSKNEEVSSSPMNDLSY